MSYSRGLCHPAIPHRLTASEVGHKSVKHRPLAGGDFPAEPSTNPIPNARSPCVGAVSRFISHLNKCRVVIMLTTSSVLKVSHICRESSRHRVIIIVVVVWSKQSRQQAWKSESQQRQANQKHSVRPQLQPLNLAEIGSPVGKQSSNECQVVTVVEFAVGQVIAVGQVKSPEAQANNYTRENLKKKLGFKWI